MNLFAAAEKKATPVKKGAAKLKTIVPVNLGDKLTRLAEVRGQLADLEAEETMLAGDIKPVAEQRQS